LCFFSSHFPPIYAKDLSDGNMKFIFRKEKRKMWRMSGWK